VRAGRRTAFPKLLSISPPLNAETSYDFAKLLGASPESEGDLVKDPSSIPLFPPDGLSFLPRRRSTLKVIFRQLENVKPSVVSKRSPGAGVFKVS